MTGAERGPNRATVAAMPLMRRLLSQGASNAEIAEATGLAWGTVARAVERIKADGSATVDLSLVPLHGHGCVDMGGLNPVDGFWCSACGIAVTVELHDLDADTMEPDWELFGEYTPKYCPSCGRRIDWKGAA